MSNDTRIRIFDWYASAPVRGGVLVCFGAGLGLSPLAAFADAGLPPPAVHQQTDNGFPSSQALKNQGYDPQSGKITVNKTGSPKVSSSGGKITGTQNVRIDTVDRYGNRGAINSSVSQTVNSGALSKLAGAAYIANSVSHGVDAYGDRMANDIKDGRYSDAVRSAAGIAAETINGLSGGVFKNILKSIDSIFPSDNAPSVDAASVHKAAAAAKSAQSKAMNDGNAAGAITAAAAAKAASAAANAAAQNQQKQEAVKDKNPQEYVYVLTSHISGAPKSKKYYPYYTNEPVDNQGINISYGKESGKGPKAFVGRWADLMYSYAPQSIGQTGTLFMQFERMTIADYAKKDTSNLNPSDMALTADEVKKILEQMLNNQQTNHKELMEQLSKINAGTTTINNTENNTTINSGGNRPKGNSVVDKATENVTNKGGSTRSAPYTPAGSSQAQQTEWTLNPDGSVTTNIIPRPDLKPNSSQAPTRSGVYGNNQSQNSNQAGQNQQGNQPSQNQQQQQQNFCKENPNSAACAELGDSSYEDLLIPENPVDLELKPLDIFSTDGVCPANPTFTFGALGTLEIDYQYFCSIARLLRPILILGTMIMCGFVAYNAVKEL